MKRLIWVLGMIFGLACGSAAHAAFISGSTGADGAFSPTVNTEVVLPPDGVLNYTTVNIPAGVTVTFKKNVANTPVYMLATGDVVIAGTINVNGTNGTYNIPGYGGPGGFDGGYAAGGSFIGGRGLGPGGGNQGAYNCDGGGGGGFGSIGGSYYTGTGGPTYGNMRLFPLIGGSGGGGSYTCNYSGNGPGGGGGGAIAIASSSSIYLTGSIVSDGGSGYMTSDGGFHSGGGGSGGGIKLIANTISGDGLIAARGGGANRGGGGGGGRVRIEATVNKRIASSDPPYSYGLPSSVFVANAPVLKLTTIGGTATPVNPTASFSQPDLLLPSTTTNPVAVSVVSTNIPDGTTVTVIATPQFGNPTSATAILSAATATANVNLSTAYTNVITAQATFTVVGMYYNGEEIDKVRVATRMGEASETTYITKSGKEIKGELVKLF